MFYTVKKWWTSWSCRCRFRQFIITYWNYREPKPQFWSRKVGFSCLPSCVCCSLMVVMFLLLLLFEFWISHVLGSLFPILVHTQVFLIHFLKIRFWLIYSGWSRGHSALQTGLKALVSVSQVLGILWTYFTKSECTKYFGFRRTKYFGFRQDLWYCYTIICSLLVLV